MRGLTGSRRDPLAHPEEAIRRLYAYVAYRIGPGAAAEDIVSETVERALRYRASYDPRKGSANAWLVGIASRLIADAARAAAEQATLERELEPEQVDDPGARSLRLLHLRWGMALLDERSRDLLALRYGADLKAREIAELLDMQTNAVEVALSRALARLRAVLDGDEAAVEGLPAPAGSPSAVDAR